jgi:predicted ATPase
VVTARVDPRLEPLPEGCPFVPAVRDLAAFRPDPGVTFIVGENGSGKSTLVEALAIASGFSAQGGTLSRELGFSPPESDLHELVQIEGARHKAPNWVCPSRRELPQRRNADRLRGSGGPGSKLAMPMRCGSRATS